MKKIGIVSIGYGWLPCESGPSRFYYISKIFAEQGYDVELITTSFQHFRKEPRDKEKILSQGYPFRITFLDAPAYQKNIDLKRIYSNLVFAKNLKKYLEESSGYDVIYCSIPSNRAAVKVAEYCKKTGTPLITDVEDLWPEAMEMVIHNGLARKLLFPLHNDAEKVYSLTDAVIGTSEEYTARAYKYQKRNIPYKTVYVGCDMDQFDDGIKTYAPEIEKPENEKWVMYTGSIGTSYNIDNLVNAAKILADQGRKDIRFMILGTGPEKEKMEQLAKDLNISNISFLGYVAYPKMAAYLSKCDLTVNSFVKGAPQSIVNKVGDYLAAGKPMINTLESEEFMNLLNKYDFGKNVVPGNAKAFADAVIELLEDKDHYAKMSENARKLAEDAFDRKHSYLEMVHLADQLIEEKKHG